MVRLTTLILGQSPAMNKTVFRRTLIGGGLVVAALLAYGAWGWTRMGQVNSLGLNLAQPDALVVTSSLSTLPRDLLTVPLARDLLREDFLFYYEQSEDRLGLKGSLRRIAYEHDLAWGDQLLRMVLDQPAEVALWRDADGSLKHYAIAVSRSQLARLIEQAGKVALKDTQMTLAGELNVDGDTVNVFALEYAYHRTLLFAAHGQRMVILSHPGMLYGGKEGNITEVSSFDPDYGWYAAAKCEAELQMDKYAQAGGQVVSFRPGCVHGPGSHLWVSRPANLLKTYRLGDLGDAGDGWSNLVHVDDVVRAIQIGLEMPVNPGEHKQYNLSAPDSPRWNQYLFDLASAIRATPVRRLSRLQLKLDSKIISPSIKIGQILLRKLGQKSDWLPEPLPPSLVRLFDQHIFLNSEKFSQEHHFSYMSYKDSLRDSLDWLIKHI